ncbi:MAG: hypothetical protein GY882_01940 [Actinomycetia bacterium]|nr:hypothetical protein [Actinomycetes bacterium]MCP4845025.1 hypothetical protein [Actinomycetes bacterium]
MWRYINSDLPKALTRICVVVAILSGLALGVFAQQPSGIYELAQGPMPDVDSLVFRKPAGASREALGNWRITTVSARALDRSEAWWRQLTGDVDDLHRFDVSKESASHAMSSSSAVASALAADIGDDGKLNSSASTGLFQAGADGVGGASAGLVFTLAFVDARTSCDLTGGLTLSGTGTVDMHGTVGPILGIRYKATRAAAAGVDAFFAPAEQAAEAAAAAPDMVVVGVETVERALDELADMRADTAGPFSCIAALPATAEAG